MLEDKELGELRSEEFADQDLHDIDAATFPCSSRGRARRVSRKAKSNAALLAYDGIRPSCGAGHPAAASVATHAYFEETAMRIKSSVLAAALVLALSTAAHSQAPATAGNAPAATPPATGAQSAPKRDLNAEAMKGMTSSRSSMSEQESKQRRADKAEKQAQRAKMKAEEAQKKADASKTAGAQKKADAAKKQAEAAQKKAEAARKQAEEARTKATAAKQ